MIKFEILTDDPADQELVARYWAMDEDGKFIENVSDLLPYKGISSSYHLLSHIQKVSIARDHRIVCSRCSEYFEARSRADYQTRTRFSTGVCDACREQENLKQMEEQRILSDKLSARLKEIEDRNTQRVIDYETIPDDIALILIALNSAINPRLLTGLFSRDQCQGLAPCFTSALVTKLWKAGVIADLPSKALPGAYFLRDDEVWHTNTKVSYFLLPDHELGKTEAALDSLRNRAYTQFSRIRQLWLDYAVSECMQYLYDQCSLHRLQTSDESDEQAQSVLRTSLETYSIAQLWSVIWKVVRDAASLSAREYYNKEKAASTIHGKIKRYLERAAREGLAVKSWDRPGEQPAGTLGDVFYEFFGLYEYTPGREAMEILADQNLDEDEVGPPSEVVAAARIMMQRAIEQGCEATILLSFAERIRQGEDVQAALEAVCAANLGC
ncbi:MAG: hypothetical protein GX049_06085 [Alcaligenaceae bacterium]|nr:hypothetical protein [Alcaligenaceae bacterium]